MSASSIHSWDSAYFFSWAVAAVSMCSRHPIALPRPSWLGIGVVHTQWALREAPHASPRESRNRRNPAGGGERELLGEHARSEGAEGAGDGSHFGYEGEERIEQQLGQKREREMEEASLPEAGRTDKYARQDPPISLSRCWPRRKAKTPTPAPLFPRLSHAVAGDAV